MTRRLPPSHFLVPLLLPGVNLDPRLTRLTSFHHHHIKTFSPTSLYGYHGFCVCFCF